MKSLVIRISSSNNHIDELRSNFLQAWELFVKKWDVFKYDSHESDHRFEFQFEDISYLKELHDCQKCKAEKEADLKAMLNFCSSEKTHDYCDESPSDVCFRQPFHLKVKE